MSLDQLVQEANAVYEALQADEMIWDGHQWIIRKEINNDEEIRATLKVVDRND